MDKRQTYSSDDVRLLEDMAEAYGRNQGRQEERARIRKELLEAFPGALTGIAWIKPSDFRAALDRICPE